MHDGSSSTSLRGTPSRRGRPPRILLDSPNLADTDIHSHSLSSNRATTFTTSLSIAVEGATRVVTNDSTANPGTQTPQRAPITDGKRAPRKSKTDALAALHTHARSSSIGPDDLGLNDTNDHQHFPRPIPVAPRLDLSTVKTNSPRSLRPATAPRPFDLEDCPTFYPTMEEFKDPMSYIRSISDRAKTYGLCKVVPPAEWKMPFVADTEVSKINQRSGFSQMFLIFLRLDISVQDTSPTAELHRGFLSSQSQLSGAIISFPQTAGQPSSRCALNQPQATRSLAFAEGGPQPRWLRCSKSAYVCFSLLHYHLLSRSRRTRNGQISAESSDTAASQVSLRRSRIHTPALSYLTSTSLSMSRILLPYRPGHVNPRSPPPAPPQLHPGCHV